VRNANSTVVRFGVGLVSRQGGGPAVDKLASGGGLPPAGWWTSATRLWTIANNI
jgi:hypothetical protein